MIEAVVDNSGLTRRQIQLKEAQAAHKKKYAEDPVYRAECQKRLSDIRAKKKNNSRTIEGILDSISKRTERRSYTLPDIVDWVAEHILFPIDKLDANDVPNGQALAMWDWARKEPEAFRSMYDSKRMPNRAQIDRGIGMSDSGSEMSGLIDELLKVGRS